MASIDPRTCREMEELLSAYALDALDPGEAARVEAHLYSGGGCPRCRRSLAEERRVAALLGEAVSQGMPPDSLQGRLMAALGSMPREVPTAPIDTPLPRAADGGMPSARGSSRGVSRRRRIRLSRLVLPLAAAVAVVLLAISLGINLLTVQRLDRLERESAGLSSQLIRYNSDESYLSEGLRQIRLASYLIASPDHETMTLEAVGGAEGSQGLLLVSGDGRRAILMVAGMTQQPDTADYRVWFMRPGQRVNAGEVMVDASGWGIIILYPSESVFGFDWVGLTSEETTSVPASASDMVLRGRITSQKSLK